MHPCDVPLAPRKQDLKETFDAYTSRVSILLDCRITEVRSGRLETKQAWRHSSLRHQAQYLCTEFWRSTSHAVYYKICWAPHIQPELIGEKREEMLAIHWHVGFKYPLTVRVGLALDIHTAFLRSKYESRSITVTRLFKPKLRNVLAVPSLHGIACRCTWDDSTVQLERHCYWSI